MEILENIETRFGPAAAKAVEGQIGNPPGGSSDLQPAPKDRSRGALIGAVLGEALGEPVEDRPRNWIVANFGFITGHVAPNPKTGSDTQLTLMTADSILAGADAHPERFAARLAATTIDTRGQAVLQAQAAIREGRHWWSAATTFSAGTSGAARCAAFGLMWAGDPQRAAYEAALSTSVTHGHPVATSAAAAFAAAVALAANDDGPLDADWLIAVADICAEFNQSDIDGATVIDRIRILPAMLTQSPEAALSILGTDRSPSRRSLPHCGVRPRQGHLLRGSLTRSMPEVTPTPLRPWQALVLVPVMVTVSGRLISPRSLVSPQR